MPSERKQGTPAAPDPLRRPGQFGSRPGSPNRGFASVDPERQRQAAGQANPDGSVDPAQGARVDDPQTRRSARTGSRDAAQPGKQRRG